MRTTLTRLLGVLVAVVLVVAACGDDDSTAATRDDSTAEIDATGNDGVAEAQEQSAEAAPAGSDDDVGAQPGAHEHGDGVEVPDGLAVPAISIEVIPDPVAGQNLFIDLVNFTVAPERASTEPVDGEGHLHLYVDGERKARFYNTALHLDLEPGAHEVMVEVSANNHAAYTVDGMPIRAMVTVDVPATADEHSHASDPVEAGEPVPAISVDVVEDPNSGWNITVELDDFTLTPRNAGLDHVDGEGHMHLYVDGHKVGRLYGTAWHLPALTEGDHDIAVELSANSHAPYVVDGEPIRAITTVTVDADRATPPDGGGAGHDDGGGGHDHDGGDHSDHDDGSPGDGGEDDHMPEADVVVDVGFDGSTVTVADDRIEVSVGSTVALVVTSEVADHIHLHGYDLFVDVVPGVPAVMTFTADIPGLFEVEFEDSGRFIAELEVR